LRNQALRNFRVRLESKALEPRQTLGGLTSHL
jgi:hypothetical protein